MCSNNLSFCSSNVTTLKYLYVYIYIYIFVTNSCILLYVLWFYCRILQFTATLDQYIVPTADMLKGNVFWNFRQSLKAWSSSDTELFVKMNWIITYDSESNVIRISEFCGHTKTACLALSCHKYTYDYREFASNFSVQFGVLRFCIPMLLKQHKGVPKPRGYCNIAI